MKKSTAILIVLLVLCGTDDVVFGQASTQSSSQGNSVAQSAAQTAEPARPPSVPVYPVRPKAPADVVARGRALYGVNCSFCHGSDARGGEGGPNLVRSQLVLNDQNGELIAQVVQNGRVEKGMPRFDLTAAQVADIAAFIHDFPVSGTARGLGATPKPLDIVVGDPKAGEAYFNKTCASCHSVTGDLAGIASRAPDERTLQQFWLMPSIPNRRNERSSRTSSDREMKSNVPPVTATVTLASGEQVKGELARLDDFSVSLIMPDESRRTFRRHGPVPKIEIHDPLKPHRDLLPKYTDKQIHDLTSYLVTIR